MLRVAVVGGKGGSGKTTIAVSLAWLLREEADVCIVDSDVENPCVPCLLGVTVTEVEKVELFVPRFIEERCTKCGACGFACPAHAIVAVPGKSPIFLPTLCEGCGACLLVCQAGAIAEGRRPVGRILEGEREDIKVIVGELIPGERRHHAVLSKTLERIDAIKADLIIIDTPPGTGAGVLEILRKSDMALVVAEPTRLGIHDTRRLCQLLEREGKEAWLVLNKAGIAGGFEEELRRLAEDRGMRLFEVPYDRLIPQAYARGCPPPALDPRAPSVLALSEIAKALSALLRRA